VVGQTSARTRGVRPADAAPDDRDHGEVGHVRLAEPGTIWLTVGMRSRDICATVVHELAHVGQLRGGRPDPSTDAEDETEARAMERSFMDWLER
jgi:hypothetical protein